MPRLVKTLHKHLGVFPVSIAAEQRTVEEYLATLANGTTDVLICYAHPSIPFDIDSRKFPFIDIDSHGVFPFIHKDLELPDFDTQSGDSIPYIKYGSHTYMMRVVDHILKKAPFKDRLTTIFSASLVETVASAANHKFGVTWLPEPAIGTRIKDLAKIECDWNASLSVRMYFHVDNDSQILNRIRNYYE